MKKKILVVDDSPKNIEVAKAFFGNNSEYEFIYAMDNKTGEELLDGCDAVITDRSMPYKIDEKEEDYQDEAQMKYERSISVHGFKLFAAAKAKGLPAVMISSHGPHATLFKWISGQEGARKYYELLKTLDPYSVDYGNIGHKEIIGFGKPEEDQHITSESLCEVNKENPLAWKLGFAELLKDIENQEVTHETKMKIR